MPSILFVCTANRFRSPLAAAFLRRNLKADENAELWNISSAGTWATPGLPVVPGLVEEGQKYGIDLAGHRSQRVTRTLLSKFDLIVVMQAGHKEALLTEHPGLQNRVYLLSEVAERRSYDIPDAPQSEEEIREVVTELDSLLRQGSYYLCALATYLNKNRRTTAN
jgi:protein-tyrosine phosphatase